MYYAGAAAENLTSQKYNNLLSSYVFEPFGIETLGPWGPTAHLVLRDDIAKRLIDASRDKTTGFFSQRISIAIQRGNAASVLGTSFCSPIISTILSLVLSCKKKKQFESIYFKICLYIIQILIEVLIMYYITTHVGKEAFRQKIQAQLNKLPSLEIYYIQNIIRNLLQHFHTRVPSTFDSKRAIWSIFK